jgi:hypothetical protein
MPIRWRVSPVSNVKFLMYDSSNANVYGSEAAPLD